MMNALLSLLRPPGLVQSRQHGFYPGLPRLLHKDLQQVVQSLGTLPYACVLESDRVRLTLHRKPEQMVPSLKSWFVCRREGRGHKMSMRQERPTIVLSVIDVDRNHRRQGHARAAVLALKQECCRVVVTRSLRSRDRTWYVYH